MWQCEGNRISQRFRVHGLPSHWSREVQQPLYVEGGERRTFLERQALHTVRQQNKNKVAGATGAGVTGATRHAVTRTCQVPKTRRERGALRKQAHRCRAGSVSGVNVAGANVARGPCHTEWLARQSKQLSDRITRQERRFEVWTLPAANFGGDLHEHVTYFRELAKQVDRVEIFDPCFSACTLVTVYIEKERLCFGEQASLNFHQAQKSWTDQSAVIEATKWMIAQYPMDIREWILRKGGHDSMPAGFKYWTLPASELWEMGYRKCSY